MMQRQNRDLDELLLLVQGFQVARLVKSAADLKLADDIAPATRVPVADLAAARQVDAGRLLRAIRALASFGVFTVDEFARVGHSSKSLLLRTDSANSLHHMARFWAMPSNWSTWAVFDCGLSAGPTASEIALGASRMDYFNAHTDEAAIFNSAMAHRPEDSHTDVAEIYDFAGASLIVDVGGGNGALLRNILSRCTVPRGITFDREEVVGPAREFWNLKDFGERHQFASGDFLQRVPENGDIYIFSDVLSNLSDETCVQVLRVCRSAMRKGRRVLIVERLLDPDPTKGYPIDFLIDIHFMLNYRDARLRSALEYQTLLSAAAFGPMRVIPTRSSVAIIESAAV